MSRDPLESITVAALFDALLASPDSLSLIHI